MPAWLPPALVPLTVALPLAMCALILALAHRLPGRLPDALAVLTALAVAALCAVLAVAAAEAPVVHWFGGWGPRDGAALGIAFRVDAASGWVAAFIGLLFCAAFVFAWGFFEETHGHFQILMLLFLAAMIGFCLTNDLFNLFVWFEVMSVAAFALTAYRLGESALAGALNFTVVNSLAGFLMLAGIGLLYARTGALDLGEIARTVAAAGRDPVCAAAFCLIATALLIKAAAVPFQFWLSDAHAVAPSPVSVIFSGAMVGLGLFGLAKLVHTAFSGSEAVRAALPPFLSAAGAATALLGGAMALLQRHLKRMLAFSTIAHAGILLLAIGTLAPGGTAGLLVYLVGHGLVKAALFMVAGILLATRASIDEIALRGLGRGIAPAGIAMGLAGLLLCGLPVGLLDHGTRLVHGALAQTGRGWAVAVSLVAAALTGAAVLRAAGRIFLGLGPDPGDEAGAPSEAEQERANRPLWLMLAPCALLLALDIAAPHGAVADLAARSLPGFVGDLRPPVILPEAEGWPSWLAVAGAILVAAYGLFRAHLPAPLLRGVDAIRARPARALESLHSGLIGDYVAWMAVGLAVLAATLALA